MQQTLKNGLKVVYNKTDSTTANVRFIFNVGSKDDGELPGLSHLTEHMAFRGTKDRTAHDIISKILFNQGGGNATTSYSSTDFYSNIQNTNYTELITTMVDMFSNSTLQNLEIEKKALGHELDVRINDPMVITANLIFSNALGKSIYDYTLHQQTLPKITVDDIRNHINKYYIPSNATLIITGNVGSQDTLLKIVEALTANWKQPDIVQNKATTSIEGDKLSLLQRTKILEKILQPKAVNNFEYKPGLYKQFMDTKSVYCTVAFKGSPASQDNVVDCIKQGILVNLFKQDIEAGNAHNIMRGNTGLTYSGVQVNSNNAVDFGYWSLGGNTDKKSASILVTTIANYIKDFKSKINIDNVFRAINHIKYSVSDDALRDGNISQEDFYIAANQITARNIKEYFDKSIGSKCTVAVVGGFYDTTINDVLYAEVNDILASSLF